MLFSLNSSTESDSSSGENALEWNFFDITEWNAVNDQSIFPNTTDQMSIPMRNIQINV